MTSFRIFRFFFFLFLLSLCGFSPYLHTVLFAPDCVTRRIFFFFFFFPFPYFIDHSRLTVYISQPYEKKYGKDRLFFGWVGKAVWRPRRKWYATTQRWHCARTSARPLQQQCVRRRMIRSLFPFMFFFSSSVFSFRSLNSIILLFFFTT